MARNFFPIFAENNPVMGYSKTFFYSRSEGVNKNFMLSVQFGSQLSQSEIEVLLYFSTSVL